jgi:hypothetical protein
MLHRITIRDEVSIQALPSRVWVVLTFPEYTRQYNYYGALVSQWTKGSSIELENNDSKKGIILDITPGMFIRYSLSHFIIKNDPEIISYELLPDDNGVRLKLTYDFICQTTDEYGAMVYNCQQILHKIKWLAEYSGEPKKVDRWQMTDDR